jgi:hypothetical protein
MKQHITIEQLKELNIIQLNDLVITLKMKKYWYKAKMRTLQYNKVILQEIANTCTIGKMIEILIENIPKTNCIEDSIDIECDRVTKTFLVEYRTSNFTFADFENKELCDALWEAVKSILKKEN